MNPARSFVILAVLLALSRPLVGAELLSVADFETGELTQIATQKGVPDALQVVTSPVRSGKYAAKVLLRVTDPEASKGQRAEFSDGRNKRVLMNQDYWYGLSIFVPEDFVAPATDAVLFQWHTQQGGPSPVLAIRIKGGEWVITSNAVKLPRGERRVLARVPFERNKWTDWVVHAHWAAEPTGFWTIWKNGVELVNEKNIVTQYPEALGPYAKFGQYHSVDAGVPRNVIYVDEFRVMGPGGRYEDVAPGATRPAPR